MCPVAAHADKAARLNDQGIESYNENDHEESVRSFTEALVERPDSPELRFNRGTALSAAGKTDEAVTELERAADTFGRSDLSAAAHFNAGNTHLAAGSIEEAIGEYIEAVKLDQSSKDIRHNLELAVRMLEQQQQQQENSEENKDEENKDQQDENQDSSDQKNEQEENKEQDQNQSQEDQEREQNEDQNQPQPQESEPQPMTPEEAQRILDAMNDEEKEAFELRKMMMKETMRQGDDW
jgi:Ca-activated chloride channel homolog